MTTLIHILQFFDASNFEYGNAWTLFAEKGDQRANLLIIGLLCRQGRILVSDILREMKSAFIKVSNKRVYELLCDDNTQFFKRMPLLEKLYIDGGPTRKSYNGVFNEEGEKLYNVSPGILRDIALGEERITQDNMIQFGYYNSFCINLDKLTGLCSNLTTLIVDGVGCCTSENFQFTQIVDSEFYVISKHFDVEAVDLFLISFSNSHEREQKKRCYFTGGIVMVDSNSINEYDIYSANDVELDETGGFYDEDWEWSRLNGPPQISNSDKKRLRDETKTVEQEFRNVKQCLDNLRSHIDCPKSDILPTLNEVDSCEET